MLYFVVFVLILFSFSDGQPHSMADSLALPSNENEFKIELIDVKCDENQSGMSVKINFNQPFGGVIYSRGYFDDDRCKYVSVGENKNSYEFVVPFDGCGSKASCAFCTSIENILIIQHDEEVQGEFDSARKISCSRTGIDEETKVFFKPFVVDMLDVITVPTSHGDVDCWMDVQRGIYPKLTSIGDVIKIGEELTVLVYLRDNKMEYDLSVRNCWAYDNEDFEHNETGKVQLSDASGCTMKRKLFGIWQKTKETGTSGATLLLHNTLRAFKFPDESQVYLKCDIEICRGTCAEAICDDDFGESEIVDCKIHQSHPKCIDANVIDRFTTPLSPERFTTTTEVYEEISTYKSEYSTEMTTAGSTISNEVDTTTFPVTESTSIYDRVTTRRDGFSCYPGSKDVRCIVPENSEVSQKQENSPDLNLYETSTDQMKTTSLETSNQMSSSTKRPSFCERYPNSKRCISKSATPKADIEILTFEPPPFTETKNLDCSTNPNDMRCKQLVIPLQCGSGSPNDPRCPNPTSTAKPQTYLPPSPTLQSTTTGELLICVPGANGDCENAATTEIITTTGTNPTQTQTVTQPQPICAPGNSDPECEKVKTDISMPTLGPTTSASIPSTKQSTQSRSRIQTVSTTKKSSSFNTPKSTAKQSRPNFATKTTKLPCYPGSSDPRCTKAPLNCEKNPDDIRCNQVAGPLKCDPGSSKDIRCKNLATKPTQRTSTTTRQPIKSTTKLYSTKAPICYPGSLDVRCSSLTTKKNTPTTKIPHSSSSRPDTKPNCYPGSLDSRCKNMLNTTKIPPNNSIPQRKNVATTIPNSYPLPKKPICYPGVLDPRCSQSSTKQAIPSNGAPVSEPKKLTVAKTTTEHPAKCYLGSTDPRCKQQINGSTSTPNPLAYLPPHPSDSTVREGLEATTDESSLNGRLDESSTPQTITTTIIPTTFAEDSGTTENISTTETTQTDKVPRVSSPRPFTKRPDSPSTTENLLCYPGSPLPECASSSITTPSFCFPGSKDKRCPQFLPNTFSTRQPSTYLPPFPENNFNRVKRSANDVDSEIIKFPISVKSLRFN